MEIVYVYFVLNPKTGEIKIGQSCDVQARLHQLETEEGTTLYLLGVQEDVIPLEKRLHQKFSGLRTRGEWFRAERDLRTYILNLNPSKEKISITSDGGVEVISSIKVGWERVKSLLTVGNNFRRADVEILASCSRQWAVNIINYGRSLHEVVEVQRGLYRYDGSS